MKIDYKALKQITIEEFDLPEPDNYESLIQNADRLFAELLIKYYQLRNDFIKMDSYGNLTVINETVKVEKSN